MNFQGVHAKVLILQYILGVAHFSASNIVFPPGGRLRPKKVHHLQETDCPLKTTKNREKKEERELSSKFMSQFLRKRFQISE